MPDTSVNTPTEEIIVHGIYTYKLNAVDEEGKKKYAVVYFESAIKDVRLTGFKKIDNPEDIPDIDYETDTLDKMLQALEARISFPKTFGPASSLEPGSDGAVPAPARGDQNKYLRADGTWQIPGVMKLNAMTPDANGDLTIKISQIENDARDTEGHIVGYALTTDIPYVWDQDGHLVSPAGWKLWITDEDTPIVNSGSNNSSSSGDSGN